MAKVTFKPGQPIQSLSGTLGRMTFRTIYGHTSVFEKPEPTLPKNATRKQKAQFKKQTIIDNCLTILQSEITDIQKAINARKLIRDRIVNLYKKFAPTIKAPTKLQRKIMETYREKFHDFSES